MTIVCNVEDVNLIISRNHNVACANRWVVLSRKNHINFEEYLKTTALEKPPDPFSVGFALLCLTFYPPPPANSGPVTVRIFNKANPELFLTGLWNGKVVMMLGNGTTSYQQWILDTTWGDKFTDAVGYKAFMLVNRASGMILRHGYSENSMVTSTTKAKADLLETLWSRGPDLQGFHTIRACSKVELIMDVDHGDKRHLMVPVKEGFKVVMFKMSLEETQYWRMEPLP